MEVGPPQSMSPSGRGDLRSSEIEEDEITLGKLLGVGSFGAVYEGLCRSTTVAVKILLKQDLSEEQLIDFRREIYIMATNTHPNIVLFLGACTVPGSFKIVMEKLDGDLETLLLDSPVGKSLSLFDRLFLAKQAAEGMNWLHCSEPAIIHRDLKLANLMYKKVENTYLVRVADFGLACIKPKAQPALIDSAQGTPLTRAPEVMEKKGFNQKADVYSFAICLWEIYSCQAVFPHHSDYDEFKKAICEDGERPPIPLECLVGLRSLLEESWHKDPMRRPDFAEVNRRLNYLLIEAAVDDIEGQNLWRSRFLTTKLLQQEVKFRLEFVPALYRYLQLTRPPRETRKATTDMNLIRYRALREIAVRKDRNCKSEADAKVHIITFGILLKLFGPLRYEDGGETVLDRIVQACDLPGFRGFLEAQEAGALLGDKEGSYLIRFSMREPIGYAISRFTDGEVKHTKIYLKSDTRELYVSEQGKMYPNMTALIQDLKDSLKLLHPVRSGPYQKLRLADEDPDYVTWTEEDENHLLSSQEIKTDNNNAAAENGEKES